MVIGNVFQMFGVTSPQFLRIIYVGYGENRHWKSKRMLSVLTSCMLSIQILMASVSVSQ